MKRKIVILIIIAGIIAILLITFGIMILLHVIGSLRNSQGIVLEGGSHILLDNDRDIANAKMDTVLEAIKNKDKDALKAMFSKKAISQAGNFDESINQLFEFFQGDFISYNDWGGPGAYEDRNYGDIQKELDSTYDVTTSKQKYRFAIKEFTADTVNPDNVGIWSLYIIKMEDTDPQFAYLGDGKDTPGINFNKINEQDN